MNLNWPEEKVLARKSGAENWHHAGSNYCLDFHGDPRQSELVVFSDGNHHMALEQTLEAFRKQQGLNSIFYCTTPPQVYLNLIKHGGIDLGNLRISVSPDVVIGPEGVFKSLALSGKKLDYRGFAQSIGCSILVAKGNPKSINCIEDLLRGDLRLFISNPSIETASYDVYQQTIFNFARRQAVTEETLKQWLSPTNSRIVYGKNIHHREAPQAIASDFADAAVIYHHLALRYTRIFANQFDLVPLAQAEDNITTEFFAAVYNSQQPLAQKFLKFLSSSEAQAIYQHHGLAGA